MSEPQGEDARLAGPLAALWRSAAVRLGAGEDDAAIVRVGGEEVVLTTDALVDGVHFELERAGPEAVAWKALAVNVSDLAAMGAEPLACLAAVVLPREGGAALLEPLLLGLDRAARALGCPLVGGDTNVGPGPLTLALTALGRLGPAGALTRAGARVGDHLSVTGPLGGSRAGRHLAVRPRVAAARALLATGLVHAGMDLSDGLARDLPRLCRASGVGARIDAARLPVHPDALALGGDPVARALGDGEDFELLVAHAPLPPGTQAALAGAGVTLIEVGEVRPREEGLGLLRDGRVEPLPALGHDHFLGA